MSVVIITYNHVNDIARAIEGVLNQNTKFPFEVVIGDDCSTDGTSDIVLDFKNKHPRVIRVIASDRNVGMVKNFIRTSKVCVGEFIAFCEGDDYWHRDDKLQLQVDHFVANPSCGLVCSNYDVRDSRSTNLIKNFITYKGWRLPTSMTTSDWITDTTTASILTVTVMVRRALFERVVNSDPYLYESDSFLMYDVPLWAEMLAVADVGYIAESLATYNVSENSVTRTKNIEKRLRFTKSIYEMGLYLCHKYGMPEYKRVQQEGLWCRAALNLACHTRDGILADEIRRGRELTWKDWFRYYASKYSIAYYTYRLMRSIRRSVVKESKKWYE